MSSDDQTQAQRLHEGDSAPYLSIAAPAYNEAEVIQKVVLYWGECLERMDLSGEIVLCNDGSTDGTKEILASLQEELPCLRVVGSEENHGYGAALATAIAACKGNYIATIDSDGQFDLMDIKNFLVEIEKEGVDGVVGYRVAKQDSPARVLADRCLNGIARALFGTRLRDTNCAKTGTKRSVAETAARGHRLCISDRRCACALKNTERN